MAEPCLPATASNMYSVLVIHIPSLLGIELASRLLCHKLVSLIVCRISKPGLLRKVCAESYITQESAAVSVSPTPRFRHHKTRPADPENRLPGSHLSETTARGLRATSTCPTAIAAAPGAYMTPICQDGCQLLGVDPKKALAIYQAAAGGHADEARR